MLAHRAAARLGQRIGGQHVSASECGRRPVHVAVTGAAGQVSYALLFRSASGALLAPEMPVVLRLIEIESILPALEGVVMELEDSAFPLLAGAVVTSSYEEAFDGASWALLVGAIPRKEGVMRAQLLAANGASFREQGRAIAARAAPDVRVLVIGNPCNTNCLIARANAPEVPNDRWFAMMRLDENRAKAQLAKKAGVPVAQVTNMSILARLAPSWKESVLTPLLSCPKMRPSPRSSTW
jgi:malate dehydrogenase